MNQYPALQDFAARDRERRMQLAVLGVHDAIETIDADIRTAKPFAVARLHRDRARLVRLTRCEARHPRFAGWVDEVSGLLGARIEDFPPRQWRRVALDYMSGMSPGRAVEISRIVAEADQRIGGAA